MHNWLLGDEHEKRMEDVTLRVVKEDIAVVENLSPIRTPDNNIREVLVPGDTAIPCPARRRSDNWIQETVPLVRAN
jgi:hypothetical protein